MSLTLSIASLRQHNACDLDERVADLRRVLPDVGEDDPVPLRTWWDLPTTGRHDRVWSLRAVSDPMAGRVLGVRFACLAVRRVLYLTHEGARPACLAAIEAAELWALGPSVRAAVRARRAGDAASVAYGHASRAVNGARTVDAIDFTIVYRAARATYAAYAVARAAGAHVSDAVYASGAVCAVAANIIYASSDAYDDEHEAQRADLDRLLSEVP